MSRAGHVAMKEILPELETRPPYTLSCSPSRVARSFVVSVP